MALTQAQIAMRRTGIGSSDIPAIIGVSPFRAAIDVYMDKAGIAEARPETAAMKAGNRLERVIGEWCAEDLGVEIAPGTTQLARDYPWAVATPDFQIIGSLGAPHLIECKNVGAAYARGWRDGPPEYVLCQVYWQMYVTESTRVHVAALFGGRDFRRYEVERDDAIIASLVTAGREFWEKHVLPGLPPPLDASEASARLVARLFPTHSPEMRQATEHHEILAESYRNMRGAIREAEAEMRRLETELKAEIGDKAGIQGAFGKITWKKAATGGTDWKGLADELAEKISGEEKLALLAKYARPGSRRFVCSFRDEE